MKVRKGNRVLQIQEVELPNFLAKGYVLHDKKPMSPQAPMQTVAKQFEKPKKVEEK